MREETLKELYERKMIAIVRGVGREKICQTAEALLGGGIKAVEVALNHRSEAERQEVLECIGLLREKFGDGLLLGAGTVLTEEDVLDARNAGARYMISPDFSEDVVKRTRAEGLVSIPGALTPSELTAAWKAGGDIIKLFPAGVLGTGYIKAVREPLAHIPVSAVGGITPENLEDFAETGAVCFGIGGSLVNRQEVERGEFKQVRARATQFSESLKRWKERQKNSFTCLP